MQSYASRFWSSGSNLLGQKEWERVMKQIDRGADALDQQRLLVGHLNAYVKEFDDPRAEMAFARGSELSGDFDRR